MARGSFEWFHSELSRLLDGGLAGDEAKNNIFTEYILDIHSRAITGCAKLSWVVDLWRGFYVHPDFLPTLDSLLRWANVVQASLIDWLKGGRPRRLLYSLWRRCEGEKRWRSPPEEDPSEASIPSYAVLVSALVLLSLVYQYLTGTADLGSSKAYSRSSLDFRDIYVAIVLFLGAYVWIKFREVALRGVHKRTRVDKQGRTKVFYDARLTPPKWNGEAVPKLELGQFATEQEAHNKFLIAAFYYNRDAGLLDGWFQVPPMSEEGRSLSGPELGAWVKDQAKKVYENFKKGKEATFWQDLFKAWEDEMNVDFSIPWLLNADEHQQLALVTQLEDLGMDEAMPDDPGLECASQPFGGLGEEGLALSNGHSPGFEEGFALPALELSPNIESGVGLNDSDQWDLLQTCVSTQQQQISLQQQQISDQQQQIYLQQRQFDELVAQMLQLQSQLQKLQEPRNQNPQ